MVIIHEPTLALINKALGLQLKKAEPCALLTICASEIERRDARIDDLSSALADLIATSCEPDASLHPNVAKAYDTAIKNAREAIIKAGGV